MPEHITVPLDPLVPYKITAILHVYTPFSDRHRQTRIGFFEWDGSFVYLLPDVETMFERRLKKPAPFSWTFEQIVFGTCVANDFHEHNVNK